MKELIVKCMATGLYSGLMKPFPGTWGTLPALAIAIFLIQDNTTIMAAAALISFVASVWSSGEAEKFYGHDARKIVIDEWGGMFVALLLVPFSYANYLIAFFTFRFFDVVKIPPARQFERLPGGWGITMDDIAAGIQANIATQLIILLLNRYYH
ncbi:MAG: phosphatidylglycerophosphatase A [bacterium]|nr:phosphatidylglycerophosphatase A [bacterium]